MLTMDWCDGRRTDSKQRENREVSRTMKRGVHDKHIIETQQHDGHMKTSERYNIWTACDVKVGFKARKVIR